MIHLTKPQQLAYAIIRSARKCSRQIIIDNGGDMRAVNKLIDHGLVTKDAELNYSTSGEEVDHTEGPIAPRVPALGEYTAAQVRAAQAARLSQEKAPKARKPAKVKEKVECLCGCEGLTTSRFVPGHDARLHGQCLTAIKDKKLTAFRAEKSAAAIAYCEGRGWL